MTPRKETAVAELKRLEAAVAEAREQRQQAHAEAERLHAERDRLRTERVEAYARGDEAEGDGLGETITNVSVKGETAAAKLAGVDERVRQAEQSVQALYQSRGMELLEAEVEGDRKAAEDLHAAAHEALRLHAELLRGRQRQDAILARVPGRTPRGDGPAASHPWESELRDLERAVRQHDGPPLVVPACMREQRLVSFPGA